MHADDWASGGFAAQVMWVGTDDRQADDAWVEVGFTHGWQGSNVTTFSTARRKTDNTYTEWRFTGMDTSVNRLWTFSAYYVATSSYYAVIADGITTNYKVWSGHGRDTAETRSTTRAVPRRPATQVKSTVHSWSTTASGASPMEPTSTLTMEPSKIKR